MKWYVSLCYITFCALILSFQVEVFWVVTPCSVVVKVKLFLCFPLTEPHAMKAYWGSGGVSPRILLPRHWGWVGARAVLDVVVKRKSPSLRRESNPTIPNVQPVVQRYTNWAITALYCCGKVPNFRRSMLPPSSWWSEDGGSMEHNTKWRHNSDLELTYHSR
jgi:hypothetical protein